MTSRDPGKKLRFGTGIGARLNARTHGLFIRTGLSAGPSPRVKQLRTAYARDAITADVPGCVDELADVQAHIEDIRRIQQALWQDMLEAAGLDQDCQPGTGLTRDDGSGNASREEGDPDAVTVCPAGDDRLDRLTRKLSSLAGYQRRAAGRRRRLVLDILRDRAQQPTRS